jgi:hypothetical protein
MAVMRATVLSFVMVAGVLAMRDAQDKPNVIMFFVDDLGCAYLSIHTLSCTCVICVHAQAIAS